MPRNFLRKCNDEIRVILTAIVFMPVKLVTVADPPRMSMDETMTFVARLANPIIRRKSE